MILLALAASLQLTSPGTGCHGIDAKELARLISEVKAVEFADYEAQFTPVVGLAEYWSGLCPHTRKNLSKESVEELSNLLRFSYARDIVSSILVEVGSNLRYASGPIKAALKDAQAWDRAYMQRSPIWLGPPSGTYALRCLQDKIRTGARNKRLCWTLQSMEPRDEDDEPGAPITFEAKEIKID